MVHNTASQLPEMRLNILWALKIFSDIFLPFGRILLLFQACWDSFLLLHCQVSVPASYSFSCCHACVLALTFLMLGFCLPVGTASCKRMLPQNWIWMQVIFLYFCFVPAVRVVTESESRSRSETAARLWLFPCCPWAMSFPLESLFQQSGKWDLAQDGLWWWNQTSLGLPVGCWLWLSTKTPGEVRGTSGSKSQECWLCCLARPEVFPVADENSYSRCPGATSQCPFKIHEEPNTVLGAFLVGIPPHL